MPIRTGKQFLEALKDDRRIFMDGGEIRDIARDPRTAGAAQTLVELYDMQHDAALRDKMTFAPSKGKQAGLSFIEPRTVDVHIGRLRKLLNPGREQDPIRTVRGAGYALDDRFAKAES